MSRRLFFGLKPDKEVRNAIDRSYRRLPSLKGRPRHPEDLHMTLVFLGRVDGELDCIRDAAAGIRVPKFSMVLDRFDFWKGPGIVLLQPSMPPQSLFDLATRLNTNLTACGFEPEKRPYKPHVTLLRKAKPIEAEVPDKAIGWPVDRFCLYTSSSREAPPRYQVIDQWSLLSTDS